MRNFHIGDILSITTGRLVSPRHMDGIYDILNYMTGDTLFTHQLPRAARECGPDLLRQHPQLEGEDLSNVTADNHDEVLDEMVSKYGEELPVSPLQAGAHQHIDPIAELHSMVQR